MGAVGSKKYYHLIMNGFTRLELVFVLVILSVLSWITYGQFDLAWKKSRDIQRKSDLHEISKSIRSYFSDYGKLPEEELINSLWGKPWVDGDYIYMTDIPKEKSLVKEYCYKKGETDNDFWLMADLENRRDVDCKNDLFECRGNKYCYGDHLESEVKKVN